MFRKRCIYSGIVISRPFSSGAAFACLFNHRGCVPAMIAPGRRNHVNRSRVTVLYGVNVYQNVTGEHAMKLVHRKYPLLAAMLLLNGTALAGLTNRR